MVDVVIGGIGWCRRSVNPGRRAPFHMDRCEGRTHMRCPPNRGHRGIAGIGMLTTRRNSVGFYEQLMHVNAV